MRVVSHWCIVINTQLHPYLHHPVALRAPAFSLRQAWLPNCATRYMTSNRYGASCTSKNTSSKSRWPSTSARFPRNWLYVGYLTLALLLRDLMAYWARRSNWRHVVCSKVTNIIWLGRHNPASSGLSHIICNGGLLLALDDVDDLTCYPAWTWPGSRGWRTSEANLALR